MLTGLRAKVDFAENIGKGNYESEFRMLSEEDTMGEALIQMRDNLKKAADEDRKKKLGQPKGLPSLQISFVQEIII